MEGVSSFRLWWSRIGWESHAAVEYKCRGFSGKGGEGSFKRNRLQSRVNTGTTGVGILKDEKEWKMFRRAKMYVIKVIHQMKYEFHEPRSQPLFR